jgi:hypothetical protein
MLEAYQPGVVGVGSITGSRAAAQRLMTPSGATLTTAIYLSQTPMSTRPGPRTYIIQLRLVQIP